MRLARILLLGVLLPAFQAGSASTAPGAFDTSFNGTEMAGYALFPGAEEDMAVALQTYGKVVAAQCVCPPRLLQ